MFRQLIVLALGIVIGSAGPAWTGLAQEGQETPQAQTPSVEISIDVGMDGHASPYLISCEGLEPATEDSQGDRIVVALLSDVAQTSSYTLEELIAVTAGRATLTQTPSVELATAPAGHVYAELVDDLNGDLLPDAAFYFYVTDVFSSYEACLAATALAFELAVLTSAGPLRVWGVDAVEGLAPAVAEPLAAPAALAIGQAFARPHPAGQAHGFQFLVQGVGIQAMKVEVFGLSGERVFDSDFVSAHALNWNGLSRDGVRVANGVYLYVVTVKGADGSVLRGEVKKLVVLR